MEIPNNIYTLIAKKLDGEASQEDVLALEAWLKEAKSNQDTFQQLEEIHQATGKYLQHPVDTEKAWNRLEPKINQGAQVLSMRVKTGTLRRTFAVAAVFILIIIAGWLARALLFNSLWEKTIASGSNREQKLPDGSTVWLRKGAILEWKSDFGNNREVKLSGEAYFDVQHDTRHRFTVTTGQSVTTVMGTAFMIRSQGGFDQVIVTRGKVNVVSVIEKKPAAVLLPGDKLILSKDKLTRSSVSDSNFLAWKTGRLEFKEMNLDKVLKMLSDFYQVSIGVQSKTISEQVSVTVSFDNEPLDKALEKISMITGLKYIRQKDGTYIYNKK